MLRIEKYIVTELLLRILAIILAVGSIAVASTCIHGIVVSGLASNSHLGVAINGWFILFSLIVSIFDIVAIGELFTDIKVLNIKIPFRRSLWYLSTIIKLAVSSVSILGYLGVTIPMMVFTGRWLGKLVEHNNNTSILEKNKAAYVQLTISAVLVLVFSLGAIIRSTAMVVFILLAKYSYKWPKYNPSSVSPEHYAITESDYCAQDNY